MNQRVIRLLLACMLSGAVVACGDDDDDKAADTDETAADGTAGTATADDEANGTADDDAVEDDMATDGTGVAGSDSGASTGAENAGGENAGEDPDTETCIPSQEDFEAEIADLLASRCGLCHGEMPKFGAPYSLLDYDALLENDEAGRRKVDRILVRLSEGSMPPAGNVRPPVPEFEAITSWASCGAETPEYPTSLRASRDILIAPAEDPEGTTEVALLAEEYEVPETPEVYKNFIFSNVVDREVFVRRFDVRVDETAIVHHITLHYGETDRYLYAWAPGTGAVEFPDGGLRVKPEDSFRVEIHYNNSRGLSGIKDSSGVIFHVSDPEGTEYAMLDPNTFDIMVPPRMESTSQVTCTAESDFEIFAGLPHMHEVGTDFLHEIERADGEKETLIELSGWSFDLQYFYEMGVEMQAGDSMTLRCDYRNETDQIVRGGLGTADEMCFNFMYVTPPEAALNCPPPTTQPANLDLQQ